MSNIIHINITFIYNNNNNNNNNIIVIVIIIIIIIIIITIIIIFLPKVTPEYRHDWINGVPLTRNASAPGRFCVMF